MGYLVALELRQHLSEASALKYHLLHNHYPPVSLIFLPVAREALRLARDGDFDTKLQLPTGVHLRVSVIVEQLHLDAFLDPEES